MKYLERNLTEEVKDLNKKNLRIIVERNYEKLNWERYSLIGRRNVCGKLLINHRFIVDFNTILSKSQLAFCRKTGKLICTKI